MSAFADRSGGRRVPCASASTVTDARRIHMRDPFTRLYVHLVWATWDRLPLITPGIQPAIYRCIQAEATRLGCRVGAIGGIEDHVHVLVRYPPAVSVSEMVK